MLQLAQTCPPAAQKQACKSAKSQVKHVAAERTCKIWLDACACGQGFSACLSFPRQHVKKFGATPDAAVPLAQHVHRTCSQMRLPGLMMIGQPDYCNERTASVSLLCKQANAMQVASTVGLILAVVSHLIFVCYLPQKLCLRQ
jgi:hypothetical protein